MNNNKDKGFPVWWLVVIWVVLGLCVLLLPLVPAARAHDTHFVGQTLFKIDDLTSTYWDSQGLLVTTRYGLYRIYKHCDIVHCSDLHVVQLESWRVADERH